MTALSVFQYCPIHRPCEVIEFPGQSSPHTKRPPTERLTALLHSLTNPRLSITGITFRLKGILSLCEEVQPDLIGGSTDQIIPCDQLRENLRILSHAPVTRTAVWAISGYAAMWLEQLRGR